MLGSKEWKEFGAVLEYKQEDYIEKYYIFPELVGQRSNVLSDAELRMLLKHYWVNPGLTIIAAARYCKAL